MNEDQVWLIDYKQSLQPVSNNNDDGSSYLVATAVVQGLNLIDAIKNLEKHLESEGEKLIDYWNCERYLPATRNIMDVVKNIHVNGAQIYNDENRDQAIKTVLGSSMLSSDKVAFINSMSSTFLDDIGEGQWNE